MPPLNEIYVATHVRASGTGVSFIDEQLEPERMTSLYREKFRDIDAITLMSSTQSFKDDVRVLRRIKETKPHIIAILFGSHPTFMPDYCLKEEVVDFIVLREPEETMRYLMKAIEEKTSLKEVAGIGYRDHEGTIHYNREREFMDLNLLSIPDRSFLTSGADYFNPVVRRLPYTTIQTSRGCPGKCIFCTSPQFYGRKYRFKSAEKVLEELREIKRLGYREVFFRDETFTAMKKRNIEICEAMIREKMDLSWIANGRVDMIDKETMILMKRAGCHMLKFGVETGSDEILKNYKKGTTAVQAEKVFRETRETGLETHAHIVIGGPGETPETIDNTISFVKKLDPDSASFGILTPYPGTALFEMAAGKHPEILDGSDSTMLNLHTEGFFSESICGIKGEELSKAVVNAYRRFYLRPSYLLRRLKGIDSFEQFMILAIAGLNIFRFSMTGNK